MYYRGYDGAIKKIEKEQFYSDKAYYSEYYKKIYAIHLPYKIKSVFDY